jgi:hypothetical protein
VTDKDDKEVELAAAVQNAALEGIVIPEDEQDLIRQHQSGQLSKAEFLRRAAELASRKSGGEPS